MFIPAWAHCYVLLYSNFEFWKDCETVSFCLDSRTLVREVLILFQRNVLTCALEQAFCFWKKMWIEMLFWMPVPLCQCLYFILILSSLDCELHVEGIWMFINLSKEVMFSSDWTESRPGLESLCREQHEYKWSHQWVSFKCEVEVYCSGIYSCNNNCCVIFWILSYCKMKTNQSVFNSKGNETSLTLLFKCFFLLLWNVLCIVSLASATLTNDKLS